MYLVLQDAAILGPLEALLVTACQILGISMHMLHNRAQGPASLAALARQL